MSKITDRPTALRHCCEEACYLDAVAPNWGFLDGAFPGAIRPMDIDGVVEMGGRFLWFEYKGIKGDLSIGEDRLFEALLQDQVNTVLYVFERSPGMLGLLNGIEDAPTRGEVHVRWADQRFIVRTDNLEATLHTLCEAWSSDYLIDRGQGGVLPLKPGECL